MTYYHHWFKEFVKSKHICVHFFQMKVHFRIYLIPTCDHGFPSIMISVTGFSLNFTSQSGMGQVDRCQCLHFPNKKKLYQLPFSNAK